MRFLKYQNMFQRWKAKFYTFLLRKDFGGIGKNCLISPTLNSHDLSGVFLDDNCIIRADAWIGSIKTYEGKQYSGRLEIGSKTSIGYRSHIFAAQHVSIGKNVLMANGVYITDNLHGYEDIDMPIACQPLLTPGPVIIEDNVWLGENVCVLPNVTIGKHSVIGSNSVVTKNIPAYSVAVGVPACVIKTYDPELKCWNRVKNK